MTGSDFIVRQQQNEIKSLKDNLRAAKHTSEQLRNLIDTLNAEKKELAVALQAACDTFQPALKEVEEARDRAEAELRVLRSRVSDPEHEI